MTMKYMAVGGPLISSSKTHCSLVRKKIGSSATCHNIKKTWIKRCVQKNYSNNECFESCAVVHFGAIVRL